jgi:hypothetical protein
MKLICIQDNGDFKKGEYYNACGEDYIVYDRYDRDEFYLFYDGGMNDWGHPDLCDPTTISVSKDYFMTEEEYKKYLRDNKINTIIHDT